MASRGKTELTDKDMRENKDDINTHTLTTGSGTGGVRREKDR